MYISSITNSNPNAFKAKFLYSDSLKSVVEYAVKHNKFDELNEARKKIDMQNVKTRIKVETGTNENGFPFVEFYMYKPRYQVSIPQQVKDYVISEPITYQSNKKMVTEKFALKMLLRMSNNAPLNNMYKRIVIDGK